MLLSLTLMITKKCCLEQICSNLAILIRLTLMNTKNGVKQKLLCGGKLFKSHNSDPPDYDEHTKSWAHKCVRFTGEACDNNEKALNCF